MKSTLIPTLLLAVALAPSAQGALIVYFDNGNGLTATADFQLANAGLELDILLTNTSTAPFGGFDGGAGMVLSSINFDLGAIGFTGGTASLGPGSNIVKNSGGSWTPQPLTNLNVEYGYSNTGIGNAAPPGHADELHSITSHSNGGMAVTSFNGIAGEVGGGLDYGLVATSSTPFGNNHFLENSVSLRLTLSAPLADLSFLNNGSYIEFGSDNVYVPNIPEPTATTLATLTAAGLAIVARRILRRKGRLGIRQEVAELSPQN